MPDTKLLVGVGVEERISRWRHSMLDRCALLTRSLRIVMRGTVKLSRICSFRGRILLDHRLRINDLAVAAGGENAAKLLNLKCSSAFLRRV